MVEGISTSVSNSERNETRNNKTVANRRNDEENFFAKFGRSEESRRKLKAELYEDYLKFKVIDERRFQNRFADKKRVETSRERDTNVSNDEVPVIPAVSDLKRDQPATEKLTIDQRSAITNPFDKKLSELEQKIENLYKEKMDSPSSEIVTANNQRLEGAGVNVDVERGQRIYEGELLQRLKLIQEAEGRLRRIDGEYTRVKERLVKNRENSSSDIGNLNNGMSGSAEMNAKPTTLASKYSMQQNYRKDLEKQIREANERRQVERELDKLDENRFKNQQPQLRNDVPFTQLVNLPHNDYYKPLESLEQLDTPVVSSPTLYAVHSGSKIDDLGQRRGLFTYLNNDDDMNRELKLRKARYAQDLREQIQESRLKKELQKKREEEFDKKIEENYLVHNQHQKLVSSTNNNMADLNRSSTGDIVKIANPESNHARGGHGIFGSPLTDEQKINLQKYKEDLAKQIAEKQHFMEEEKKREKEKERREEERFRSQQLKIQSEFEEEQRRLQAKRQHLERALIVPETGLDIHAYKESCAEDVTVKHDLDERLPVNKSHGNKRLKLKNRTRRRSCVDTNATTVLLIGENREGKQADPGANSAHRKPDLKSSGTVAIIRQLKGMRNQLELEKARVERALTNGKTRTENRSVVPDIGQIKPLPRVGKRGTQLFGDQIYTKADQFGGHLGSQQVRRDTARIGELEWISEALRSDRMVQIDQQQQAYLASQDTYLRELKDDIDYSLITSPTTLGEVKSGRQTQPSAFTIPEKATLVDSNSESERSLDIGEINRKNDQINRKLETIELLNEIGKDPEAILERFIAKHDELLDTHKPMD